MTPERLEQLLRAMGAHETSIARRGGKVRCSCLLAPWFHGGGSDSKPSMVVFPQGRVGPYYSCQACHQKGSLRDLACWLWYKTRRNMMWVIEAIDAGAPTQKPSQRPEVRRRVDRLQKLQETGGTFEAERRRRRGEEEGIVWTDRLALEASDKVPEIPWSEYDHYRTAIHPYLLDRGLTRETCEAWELGHDPHMKRVLFPLRDHKGRLVSISGRLYEEKVCLRCGGKIVELTVPGKKKPRKLCGSCGLEPPPKYLHSDGFDRNLFMYGENSLRGHGNRPYVCEGHIDVLKLWQAGYRPALAILGSNPGAPQIEKLVHYSTVITVVADGDEAGMSMANLVKHMVAGRVPVIIRQCPDEKDPGDVSLDVLRNLLGDPVDRQVPML